MGVYEAVGGIMRSQYRYRVTTPLGQIREFDTSDEVAKYLGCSGTYVRNALNRGKRRVKNFTVDKFQAIRMDRERVIAIVPGHGNLVFPNIAACCKAMDMPEAAVMEHIDNGTADANGVCYDFDLDWVVQA